MRNGADANVIHHNDVEDNGGDGIKVQGVDNVISDNEVESSEGTDCRDTTTGGGTAGTANNWTDNEGDTSVPSGLCVSNGDSEDDEDEGDD